MSEPSGPQPTESRPFGDAAAAPVPPPPDTAHTGAHWAPPETSGAPTPPADYPAPAVAPAPSAAGGGIGGFATFDQQALQNFDPKSVDVKDWVTIGLGVLTFLFSFFGYYKYSVSVSVLGFSSKQSATFSAWHGFFGWFAALVALGAAAVLAASVIAKLTLPAPVRLVVLAGFAIALLSTLLALIVVPGPTGFSGAGYSFDKGHGISYWLSLLFLIGATALAYLRFAATGGKLPRRG